MTLFLVLLALQCQDCSTQCVGCTNQEVYQYPALPKMAYVPSSNLDSSEKLGGVKKKKHTHTESPKKSRMTTEHLLFLVPIENLGVQIVGSRIRDCLIPSCHSSGF